MNNHDNNQGTCWALECIPKHPQTVAAPDRSPAGDSGTLASHRSAPVTRRPRGKEAVKRYALQIEVGGAPVECFLEIHQGKTLVIRRKHGEPFHAVNLADLALREYRITKGELCL